MSEISAKLMSDISTKLKEKLENGREYRKAMTFEVREDAATSERIAEGYACTFNEPYLLFDFGDYKVYEQIDARAFDECDMSDVIAQYNHEGRVFARITNRTLDLDVDKHGLKTAMHLDGTQLGRDVWEEIKGGYSNKMSFGFRVLEDKREITEDRANNTVTVLRTITKISKLYDVSVVSIPANDATEVSARAYGEGVISELKEEILKVELRNKQKQKIRILCEVTK